MSRICTNAYNRGYLKRKHTCLPGNQSMYCCYSGVYKEALKAACQTHAHTSTHTSTLLAGSSAIFRPATDYSAQCVTDCVPVTPARYISVSPSRWKTYTRKTGVMEEWQRTASPSTALRPREDPQDAAALQPEERTPAPGLAAAARRGAPLCSPRQC